MENNKDNNFSQDQSFADEKVGQEQGNSNSEKNADVGFELSKVASDPKKGAIIITIGLAFFGFIAYKLFLESPKTQIVKEQSTPAPNNYVKRDANNLPQLPSVPRVTELNTPILNNDQENIVTPPPPPPAPTIVSPRRVPVQAQNNEYIATIRSPSDAPTASDTKTQRNLSNREKSSIILIGNSQGQNQSQVDINKPSLDSKNNFQYLGDFSMILQRGTIIEVALLNSLDTKLQKDVEAVVARDVYSANKKNILIPKGSKIFGAFSSKIIGNMARINISWNRIDLMTGYSINFAGNSVDSLGRDGSEARLDKKNAERILNLAVNTAINVTAGSMVDKLVKPPENSTQANVNRELVNNITTTLNNIMNSASQNPDPYPTPQSKYQSLCSIIPSMITDKTSQVFIKINQACLSPTTDFQVSLANLQNIITTEANNLLISVAQSQALSKPQQAAKEGFDQLTDIVKTFANEEDFTPTVTMQQGSLVKISVDTDLLFPKEAIKGVKLIQ